MSREENERHGIRLPGELLEQIKVREDKGDYVEDNSRYTMFDANFNTKKRKGQPTSRKEKRQQERELKKQKRTKKPQQQQQHQKQKHQQHKQQEGRASTGASNGSKKAENQKKEKSAKIANTKKTGNSMARSQSKTSELRIVKEDDLSDDEVSDFAEFGSEQEQQDENLSDEVSDEEDAGDDVDDDDPMEQLRRLKAKKGSSKSSDAKKSKQEIRIVKEDDLSDDSFDEDEDEEEEEEEDFDDGEEDLEAAGDEDPMEQLRRLKAKKGNTKSSDSKKSKTEIRIVKEDDLSDDSFDEEEEEEEEVDFEDEGDDSDAADDDDPMEQLRRIKEAKAKKQGKKAPSQDIRIVKEDDLQDDSFDEGSEELDGEEDDFEEGLDDEFDEDEDDEDPMEKLRRLKDAKKALSEPAKKEKKAKSKSKDVVPDKIVSSRDLELQKRDEDDMAYYAKKLGLKNGKKAKLSKQGDDDMIGGLLDGLDFLDNYGDEASHEYQGGSGSEGQEDEESDDYDDDDNRNERDHGNEDVGDDDSDNGFDEGDFDEDELRELREMEELENSDSDEPEDDGETHMVSAKENPYMAPSTGDSGSGSSSGGYIPPALRRKMALEANEVSEETLALQRSIKRPLNKLSEANITSIINEINQLYLSNPRQLVTENLTNIIMDSIQQQGRLLDTFVYLHACLVVAIHRLQGSEFGAYFIQTLIEKFDTHLKDLSGNNKEISNLTSLLSSVYTFQLVSSRLLYDIIKELISDLNESNAELLLRLIQNSGNQMRSDDPQSLKEIILLVNKQKTSDLNTRTQFLLETITSLKNNKLKVHNESSQQLIVRIKKVLGTLGGKYSDSLQVTLSDIRSVEERGKWWLVGSAWKGYDGQPDASSHANEGEAQSLNFDNDIVNDILDNAEPNWVELAKAQRMNTDIRRAIFISIMSASDYVDAMTKLDKLALKRSQEREIPRIILHCTGIEPAWNPYYGVLASKLCDNHNYRKTFQFMLWDLIKEFEGGQKNGGSDDEDDEDDFFGFESNSDDSDDDKLKKILNLGRFFGFLVAEGSLPLNILRTVNFVTAAGDTLLFSEILFVTFLDQIAKKSQSNSVGAGTKKQKKSKSMYEVKFDDKLLIERVGKAHEQPVLLKGIQYFLSHKIRKSAFITGRKQRARIEWGADTMSELIDDLLKGSEF